MQFINIHTMLKGILESGDIDCIGLFEKNDIKAINTTRNIAAHEYEELNYGLIQKAISERLPQIQKKLSEFVKSQKITSLVILCHQNLPLQKSTKIVINSIKSFLR